MNQGTCIISQLIIHVPLIMMIYVVCTITLLDRNMAKDTYRTIQSLLNIVQEQIMSLTT